VDAAGAPPIRVATVLRSVNQQLKSIPPVTRELLSLLEGFRLMVNHCIRIGLEKEERGVVITSMRKLSLACYHQLKGYDLLTCYRLTAMSKAAGILRNYRREKKDNSRAERPHAHKPVLVDCYGFRIFGRLLRIPFRKGEYIFIVLKDHTLKMLSGHRARSITLTPESLSICYSKDVQQVRPRGAMGIDRNLDNITAADTNGIIKRYGSLAQTTKVKKKIRQSRRRFTRNDSRIKKSVFGKYGMLQRNRVNHILHCVSSRVVNRAKQARLAIIMENIKGLRKRYRKGNYQGKSYRAQMNSWSYYKLQRQIEYKARWEGIPVMYVAARGTSARCSMCGSRTYPNEHRTLYCAECNVSFDRDENAARNILAKGCERLMLGGGLGMPDEILIPVRFEPNGPPGEAMVTEPRRHEVIRKVDGGKTTTSAKTSI
jgi:putative transposase